MDSTFWTTVVKSLVAPLVGLAVWYVKKVMERRWAAEDRQLTPPPAPTLTADAATTPSPATGGGEIRLISHSQFFYWWPVWLVGFFVVALTYWEGNRLAEVPSGTKVQATATPNQFLLTMPTLEAPNAAFSEATARSAEGKQAFPVRVSSARKFQGPLFTTVLVLVLFLTTFSLRGIWSAVFLVGVVWASVALAYTGGWESVFATASGVNIQMTVAGYLYLSATMFFLWLMVVFLADRQNYVIITRTHIISKVGYRQHEIRIETKGVSVEIAPGDVFLNYILGFGTGDLIVRDKNGFEMFFPNIPGLPTRMTAIEQLLGQKNMS